MLIVIGNCPAIQIKTDDHCSLLIEASSCSIKTTKNDNHLFVLTHVNNYLAKSIRVTYYLLVFAWINIHSSKGCCCDIDFGGDSLAPSIRTSFLLKNLFVILKILFENHYHHQFYLNIFSHFI